MKREGLTPQLRAVVDAVDGSRLPSWEVHHGTLAAAIARNLVRVTPGGMIEAGPAHPAFRARLVEDAERRAEEHRERARILRQAGCTLAAARARELAAAWRRSAAVSRRQIACLTGGIRD